jgi:hypothetical protein
VRLLALAAALLVVVVVAYLGVAYALTWLVLRGAALMTLAVGGGA